MDYKKIQIPDGKYIDTIKESSSVRFNYYGTPVESVGTIYTDLRDGTISDESKFFDDSDIETAVKRMTASGTWIFWIGWMVLIGASVYGFCYLENDWLNK